MSASDRTMVQAALKGDAEACRALVARLSPVIQRTANGQLLRRRRGNRHDVLDLTQDVFRVLLERDGRVLRRWDPDRGASLASYVRLVAEREIAAILQSGRRSGWAEAPTSPEVLQDARRVEPAEARVASRQMLSALLDRLRAKLSVQGYAMFEALYIEQHEVPKICADTGLSRDAVYAWRSRLKRTLEEIKKEMTWGQPNRTAVGGGTT